jgi:L-arabonate dehydrase
VRTCAAIGGSTNAVLHLIAIAGRLDVPLTLEDWDRWGRDVPTLVDLQPAGRFLMEDFYYAGGLPAVLRRLGEMNLLHRDALTVSGRSIWDNVAAAPTYNAEVIRGPESALVERGGIAVLRGNLARNGAVIKVAAATPRLTVHRGRAVVFDSIEDYRARVDDPRLDVDENSVLVLRNCGPCGYPGMAEVGNMGIPAKLLQRGVTDMVRISDARMSGTAFGTVILHVAPEATVGGALAIVQDGDEILLDVPNRRIHLDVSDQEIARRLGQWRRPQPEMDGGYQKLYVDTVLQADRGADLGFLVGRRGHKTPRPSH